MGKLMETHGIGRPTRGQKRALREAGITLHTFLPANAALVTQEEVERIEAAYDTMAEILGLRETLDELPEQVAKEIDRELFAELFGFGDAEKNLPSSGVGVPTTNESGTPAPCA